MSLASGRAVTLLPALALLQACGSARSTGSAPSTTAVSATPALPPVPSVTGPLAIKVVYPPAGATVTVRDSTFIFGSVGTGSATLRINGIAVPVLPNGSFLAHLPVPRSTYSLVAVSSTDTVRLEHPVVSPPPRAALADSGPLMIDSASVLPRGRRELRDDEPVRVSVRAPRNASVVLRVVSGRVFPLVGRGATLEERDPNLFATDVRAGELRRAATLVVSRGSDTVTALVSEIAASDTFPPKLVELGAASVAVPDTDRVINARPVPSGTYKWFLLPGTRLELTGRQGDAARVRLDDALEVWVDAAELRALPLGTARPRRVAGNGRVLASTGWVDVIIPITERPPHFVEHVGSSLILTLYGTQANTDIISFASAGDSLVRDVTWEQLSSDRARYTIHLGRAPLGYLAMWDRGSFVLRVRRQPRIDRQRPLSGLTIAVDAGHPPAGSTGPTGLYEAVPTLAISERLKPLLEARGARVVMTRTTAEALALGLRPVISRRAGAHAFVSIHLNALPDGVNPFVSHGTGTYYFHPLSAPFARHVQHAMVRAMGLRDLGVYYDNLAVVRPTWMPSILCEGAFIMIPEQEAALRSPVFQQRYALGVANGIESYFRAVSEEAGVREPERRR